MRIGILLLLTICLLSSLHAQQSVARKWLEAQLFAIRGDRARPPVQARNLFHVSLAMYEAWALYDDRADNHLLGHTVKGVHYNFPTHIPFIGSDTVASKEMAISYAAYRLLVHRYNNIPLSGTVLLRFATEMNNMGYDTSYHSTDFVNGTPAALGNYVAQQIILMGLADGSKEIIDYTNLYYVTLNPSLDVTETGASGFFNINRWQPLYILGATDQNNIATPPLQNFICPEWGDVLPFALDPNTAVQKSRFGSTYQVYFDHEPLSMLDTLNGFDSLSLHYKWANSMVAVWSSFLDPTDTTQWDISPGAKGNLLTFPTTPTAQYSFYNLLEGGDYSSGHALNPVTNLPYPPQLVKRGDYTRVVSQYWADGPLSETPPGHWFTLLNDVSDHPLCSRKFEGQGDSLTRLDWDIKSYLILGGAMHDAAIAVWSLKGWYDSPRPISVIRKMASYGQSSDSTLPAYHPAGIPLIPGFIELVQPGDSLFNLNPQNLHKIKIKSWRGFDHITNPLSDFAGVGWILGENWWPYQRRFFVTPPFAGFVSGHSTFSRAGAQALHFLTGSPFFPGGLHEVVVNKNNNFLQLEQGPSEDVKLQWATYYDASNESSLSRIYGGIHPPTDDGWGRYIGQEVATSSFLHSKSLFNAFALPTQVLKFDVYPNHCAAHVHIEVQHDGDAKSYTLFRIKDGIPISLQTYAAQKGMNTFYYHDEKPDPYVVYALESTDVDGNNYKLASRSAVIGECPDAYADFTLYPNPGSSAVYVQIQSPTEGDAEIELMDITGKSVLRKQVHLHALTTTEMLSTQDLAPGLYIVHYKNPQGLRYHSSWLKH